MKIPTSAATPSHPQPHAQQILLLRAALLPQQAAVTAWQRWRANADLDQLPPGGFLLLPLLAYNLQRHGIADPLLDKCQGIHRRTWTQQQLHLQGLTPLLQALQTAGITPILQGELALALFHYPEQGLRMVDTCHLLTAAPQAHLVPTLLTQTGWQPQPLRYQWLRALLAGAAPPQRFTHPQLRAVSLLWQPVPPPPAAPLVDHQDRQGQPWLVRELAVQCVNPTDLFFDCCVQGIVNLQWYGTIQWIADAAMLLQATAPAIDWVRLGERSRQQAMTLRLAAALVCLAQSVAAPIPPTIIETLAAQPTPRFARWEWQLCGHRPTPARKLALLWLAGQRQRWHR